MVGGVDRPGGELRRRRRTRRFEPSSNPIRGRGRAAGRVGIRSQGASTSLYASNRSNGIDASRRTPLCRRGVERRHGRRVGSATRRFAGSPGPAPSRKGFGEKSVYNVEFSPTDAD